MFAEHLHDIARTGIGTGDVDHGLVHADIAHHGATLATYVYLAAIIGEAAVETVGITDRNDGYSAVLTETGMTSVTYRLAGTNGLDRQDSGLQRTNVAQVGTREREAVEPDTQAAHIELIGRETLDAGAVTYMFQDREGTCVREKQKKNKFSFCFFLT